MTDISCLRGRADRSARRLVAAAGIIWMLLAPATLARAESDASGASASGFPLVDPDNFSDGVRAQLVRCTVRVISINGSGTGVVVGRDGEFALIVTAWHVVDEEGPFKIQVFNHAQGTNQVLHDVELMHFLEFKDLALLRARTEALSVALTICPVGTDPVPRFAALTAGFGMKAMTLGFGEVIGHEPGGGLFGKRYVMEHARMPGRSGAPLIDSRGFLVGIYLNNDGKHGYYADADAIRSLLIDCGYYQIVEPTPYFPPREISTALVGRLVFWFLLAGLLLARQQTIRLGRDAWGLPVMLLLQPVIFTFVAALMRAATGLDWEFPVTLVVAIAETLFFALVGRKYGLSLRSPFPYLPGIAAFLTLAPTSTPFFAMILSSVAFLHLTAHICCPAIMDAVVRLLRKDSPPPMPKLQT